MIFQYELNPDDNLSMNLDDLLKKAIGLLEAKKTLASIVWVEK